MEKFINDIIKHLQDYYQNLVDLTPKLILAIAIILISLFIVSCVREFANNKLKSKMHDSLLAIFIANLLKVVLIIIGFLFMFRIIGLSSVVQSILAGAGISAFIFFFALRNIGENYLAGILLALKRPFSIGDIIESNGVKGKVEALNLRDTQIRSASKNIYIPNALLIKNTLINFNRDGYLLQDFNIGLEYGSDYKKALALITKVLIEDNDTINKDYSNSAVVSGVTGNTILINIRYWVKTDISINDGNHLSEMIIKVTKILQKKGFNIKIISLGKLILNNYFIKSCLEN